MVKRPIVIACIGYIIGIIYGLYFIKISIAFLIFSLVFIILSKFLKKKIKKYLKLIFPKKVFLVLLISIVIGVVNIFFLNQKYEEIYKINSTVEVMGIVERVEIQEYSNKYIINVESVNRKKYKDTKLILYTKKDQNHLEYGDYIKLTAEYSKPDDSRNYKGFSYKNYLKQNKIYGTIKSTGEIEVIEKEKVNCINLLANNIRNSVINEANANLSKDTSSVFLGILLGEKAQISDEINTYFREGNMAHILAVSGAHVSYIMLTLSIVLGKTQKKFYLICTILVLIFFMILTNFSPSVVRACVMTIIAVVAKLIYRKSDIYNNLGLSCLIILLYNPYTIFNIGFQLTYLGTVGIVLLNKKISVFLDERLFSKEHKYSKLELKNVLKDKFKKSIINLIIISISVQILIAPIILINFNTLSYNFLISGVISTPIFAGIMIVGIFSLIIVPLKSLCFPILEVLVSSLIFISKFVSSIPFSKITIPTPNIIWIISYYIIFIVVLLSKNKTVLRIIKNKQLTIKILKKVTTILLIICLIVQCFPSFINRDLRIYFIDVGQGDSSLIITPKNKVILIDGGGSLDESYDVGKNILVPYLLDRGISSIDFMMISHFDNDHCGGLMYVLETLKVKNVLISKQSEISKEYETFMELVKEKNINTITVKQGDTINIEKDIKMYILYPETKLEFDDLNNNSIVAKLLYKNFSILFTGDIGAEAENKIIEKYNQNILKSTILKVAHHGSKTSSTEKFIELTKPKVALIGVGKDNTFGHPNGGVLERLQNINCKIYRTDEHGEISIVVSEKGGLKVERTIKR